ncbi:Protein archease [Candidatus Entotheonellaceae bacterium PAL068K]
MPGEHLHPEIYEPLSHTADLGIIAYGRDLPELFSHAAWALFDLISDATTVRPRQTASVTIESIDLEDLLVRWLSELLYLYDTQRMLYSIITVTSLEPTRLSATLQGERLDPARHPIDTELKAVTYHQVAVVQVGERWQARVIFDL